MPESSIAGGTAEAARALFARFQVAIFTVTLQNVARPWLVGYAGAWLPEACPSTTTDSASGLNAAISRLLASERAIIPSSVGSVLDPIRHPKDRLGRV